MNLLDFITKHADKMADVPDAADLAKKLVEAAKKAGFDLLANDPKEPGYIPKSRLDEVVAARNTLKTELENRDKQLTELGKQINDNEPLLAQVKDFQTNNEKLQAQLKGQALDFAIERGLSEAKARNTKVVASLLDKSKLILGEDGKITGLAEQLENVKKSDAYLFDLGTPPAGGGSMNPPTGGGVGGAPTPADLESADMATYMKLRAGK